MLPPHNLVSYWNLQNVKKKNNLLKKKIMISNFENILHISFIYGLFLINILYRHKNASTVDKNIIATIKI